MSTFSRLAASKAPKVLRYTSMRIRTFIAFQVATVLMAASAAALPFNTAAAQQASAEKATPAGEHSGHQVHLPLIVCDKHGAPVNDLSAGDLKLTDNGHLQTIQALTQGSNGPVNLGLLVDTSRGMTKAMDSERKAAEGFVSLVLPTDPTNKTAGNQAFLIHFDHEVELLDDFTSSRDKLRNDLEQLGPTHTEQNSEGPETTDGEGGRRNMQNASPQLYDAIYLAADDLMKSKHGRKALIIFGNGVDGGSKESLSEAVDAAEHTRTPVYAIYFRGDEERTEGAYPGRHRGGMGGSWPGSGGGWPGGGYPGGRGGRPRSPQVDGKKIMEQIATRTGGLYFEAKKTADLAGIYDQVARDVLRQYLLTYTPSQSGNEADFHKIVVNAAKSDLIVAAPEGYYSTEDDPR
jgi:VWFA-related protein